MRSLAGDQFEEYFSREQKARYSTGFRWIDWHTKGGLKAGEVSIIGAQTGVGKTAFSEQLALNLARDVDVLYLPLEIGEEDTILRMALKLEMRGVNTGLYEASRGRTPSAGVITELNNLGLFVREPLSMPVFTAQHLMQMMADAGCKVVVVDHARYITGWLSDAKATHTGPALIMQMLQHAARELDVHVVVCAQLNRSAFGVRPQLSHLQDSSALEQVASQVFLLYRPFQRDGKEKDTVMEVAIAKNRSGPLALLHYHWIGEAMMVKAMTDEEEAALTCCNRGGE